VARRLVVIDIVHGHGPEGRGAEGLRAALGLYRAQQGHDVHLIFRDQGAAWALSENHHQDEGPGADVSAVMAHLRALPVLHCVEKESLEEQGFDAARVLGGFEIVDRAAVIGMIEKAGARFIY
jgi:sulfur relay (sulfurtransferase) DsrF/TusC family protein